MSNDLSTGRDRKKHSAKGLFLLIVLAVLGVMAYFVFAAKDEAEADKMYTFECNAERVEFLNRQGLIVEPDPEKEDITIPSEFNNSYNEYNAMQQSQGFDLLPYAGREVTKYTYKILNYPDLPENVVVNLIFDNHRLIAADITCNDAENGFTKPLISDTMQTSLSLSAN